MSAHASFFAKRKLLEQVAEQNRDSQSVVFGLLDACDALSDNQRVEVNSLPADWLVPNDNRLRYDAAFFISQRHIHEISGAIEDAISAAQRRSGFEATFEVKKLRRILNGLTDPPS
jgi:hypothetical protein